MTLTETGFAYVTLFVFSPEKCYLMLHCQTGKLSLTTPIPSASVRTFAVFTGPIPPELTTVTLIT